MSLNDIQLTPILTAEMYKKLLVENDEVNRPLNDINQVTEPPNIAAAAREETNWKHLGNFEKNILLLVNYSDAVHIPDEELNFLTSILSACKLTLADVGILNLRNAGSKVYKEVQQHFKSKVTILFGISPAEFEMPINFPEFQVQPFNNCTFLYTPAIGQIAADKLLKSKLWLSLKKIFGV